MHSDVTVCFLFVFVLTTLGNDHLRYHNPSDNCGQRVLSVRIFNEFNIELGVVLDTDSSIAFCHVCGSPKIEERLLVDEEIRIPIDIEM